MRADMEALFEAGLAIDLILGLVALEGAALLAYKRQTGRGPSMPALLATLAAGAFLMLALRAALTGAGWPWVAAWLLGGLIAHLFDLAIRLR